ncbi:MAG TPA: FkbM family methyltransferase [Pyrinomonadaceae bacterium]|nr:FkbM family methyltransferase [Pyrinomonadaceae bacterium]
MLKKLIESALEPLGYQLHRMPRHLRAQRVAYLPVTVGRFQIEMPSSSLLPDMFEVNPNYSSELGRLAAITNSKYPDLRVIDVGANYGDSVAVIRSVVDVPIDCVEGDLECLPMLEKNLAQFDRVRVHALFLGERTETISASVEKEGWNTTIVPSNNGSSKPISLITLDDFSSMNDSASCKVLKIDTEGFDCRIVRGGLSFIKRVKPVIALEYNRDNMTRIGETGIETLQMLKDIGYETILFYDGQGRLVLSTNLKNQAVIEDLHEYANGRNGAIYYYDLCVFHREDSDIATSFETAERARIKLANGAQRAAD